VRYQVYAIYDRWRMNRDRKVLRRPLRTGLLGKWDAWRGARRSQRVFRKYQRQTKGLRL